MIAGLLMLGALATAAFGAPSLLLGGDISALPVIEQHGGVFNENGKPDDAITIMRRHGANCFRLRLFVNPNGEGVVVNDLPYTMALARRIRRANAQWVLDFHYSDTWADPGHQRKPAAWSALSFDELVEKLQTYTRDSLLAFVDAGATPGYVQVGNEITPGFLWPDGKLYGAGDPARQWEKFARLLKAAIRGVREVAPSSRVIVHIDKGGSWPKTEWFFDRLLAHDVPFDVIGLSYYPFWHGKLSDARETMWSAAEKYDKDIFLVETAYPWRAIQGKRFKLENLTFPMSPAGQKDFLRQLIEMVKDVPAQHGLGVLWWYPESIRVPGLRAWHGGAMALFDARGEPLPAMTCFRAGVHSEHTTTSTQ